MVKRNEDSTYSTFRKEDLQANKTGVEGNQGRTQGVRRAFKKIQREMEDYGIKKSGVNLGTENLGRQRRGIVRVHKGDRIRFEERTLEKNLESRKAQGKVRKRRGKGTKRGFWRGEER